MKEKLSPFEAIVIRGGAFYQGKALAPEGRANYWKFVQNIIDQKKQSLSEQTNILDGYKSFYRGEECLRELDQGAFLALNYPNSGLLRGFWHTLLASAVVKRQTGKEVRWMQSYGSNELVAIIHVRSAESINGIIVGRPHRRGQGSRDVLNALLNNDIVGIYPEGEPSREMQPAQAGAGKLIHRAAAAGIPTVVGSAWSQGRDLNLHFAIREPADILSQVSEADPEDLVNFKTGAYVMQEIASYLPAAS